MPFKLLKKSRQYNVMSKDLYVISVICLDGSNIECTLGSESKGSECLENVCHRAGINQSEFFGLRYYPKGVTDESEMRFVDLDRPLNRQLEKYAANSKTLYLRIMNYVISGVSLITDEATRNYYFLQLKNDIIEGRISCDPKQAVILANYSRQAEYGNMNRDRHNSVDYLKSLLSFPKQLVDAGMLEILTEEVIKHHHEVHDVSQAAAEELYISLCQQLDGYGQETFMAHNDDKAEVMLGISVSGITVSTMKLRNAGSHKFFPWREILNVVNHKRTFSIECTSSNQSVGFTLPDSETGRYIWKLCVNQHTFFINYEQNHNAMDNASQLNTNLLQNIREGFNDSREDLLSTDDKVYYASNSHLVIPNNNLSVMNNLNEWMASSQSLLNTNQVDSGLSHQVSTADVNISMNQVLEGANHWNPTASNTSLINRAQSTSCLDLANINKNVSTQNKEHLKSLLPKYRPAPSYEAAIQQRYSESLPKIETHSQRQLHQYPDITQHTSIIGPHYSDASDYGLSHRFKLMSVMRPPDQYSTNRFSSTSTPDLALTSHHGVSSYGTSGSSPDLVSSRTLIQQGFIPSSIHYPYASAIPSVGMRHRLSHSHNILPHATYENLNFIETAKLNNMMNKTSSQQLAEMEYFLHKQPRNYSLNALNLSNAHINEPIYENFPIDSSQPHFQQPSIMQNLMHLPQKKPQPEVPRDKPIKISKGNEPSRSHERLNHERQYHVSGNNFVNSMSGSSSKIHGSEDREVSTSATSLYQHQQMKKRLEKQNIAMNIAATSSHTITDSDSGASKNEKKKKGEKRNKLWNILSGNTKNKQKSATLGREKDKSSKDKKRRDPDNNVHNRWSSDFPEINVPRQQPDEQFEVLHDKNYNESRLI